MAAKYYTHFLTAGAKPKRAPDSSEWSGVVELRQPPRTERWHQGAEGTAGAEFRSGLRGHQDSPLGPVALISPSGLPSLHRKSAFSPQASKAWGFFYFGGRSRLPAHLKRCAAMAHIAASSSPGRRADEGDRPMRAWALALLLVASRPALSGCGYNKLQQQDEGVKASWSEVVNQYQRRADLIPNLVDHGEGLRHPGAAGAHRRHRGARQGGLHPGSRPSSQRSGGVREIPGRRRASSRSALKSLFAVTEAYPDLKSNENFRDLQAQIEGTENRITVARNRYIDVGARATTRPCASSRRTSPRRCSTSR